MSESVDLPAHVAVLEQIAADTKTALIRIETRLDDGLREIRDVQPSDFRWLLGLVLGGIGVTISGFVGLLIAILHH